MLKNLFIIFLVISSNSYAGSWNIGQDMEKIRSIQSRAIKAETYYSKARNAAIELEYQLKREKAVNKSLMERIKILENIISECNAEVNLIRDKLIENQDQENKNLNSEKSSNRVSQDIEKNNSTTKTKDIEITEETK